MTLQTALARISELEARIVTLENGGAVSVKTLAITERDQNGLGNISKAVLEERRVLDADRTLITLGQYNALMDEVKLARTEVRELLKVVTDVADAAFAARKQAAQADAMAYDAVDLLVSVGDTLGFRVGVDPETKRLSVISIAPNAADMLRLAQEVQVLRSAVGRKDRN
jgi:hypothetical protein